MNENEDWEILKKQQEMLNQIRRVVANILTKGARLRLGNLRAVKPKLASQIEIQLFQLYQQGKLPTKITEEDFKTILKQFQSKRDIKIYYK